MDLRRFADFFVLVWCLLLYLDSLVWSVEASRKRGSKRKGNRGPKKGNRKGPRVPVYRQLKLLRQEFEYLESRHELDMDLVMADFRNPARGGTGVVAPSSSVDHSNIQRQILDFQSKLRTINISVNSLDDGLHSEKALRYKNDQEVDQLKLDIDDSINSVDRKIKNVQEQCNVDYASLKTIVDDNSNDVVVLKKKVDWIMTAVKDLLSSQGLLLKDLQNFVKNITPERNPNNRGKKHRTRPTTRQRDSSTTTPKPTTKSFEQFLIEDHRVRSYQRDSTQDLSEQDSTEVAMDSGDTVEIQTEMMSVMQKMVDAAIDRALVPIRVQVKEKDEEIRKLKDIVGTTYVKYRRPAG